MPPGSDRPPEPVNAHVELQGKQKAARDALLTSRAVNLDLGGPHLLHNGKVAPGDGENAVNAANGSVTGIGGRKLTFATSGRWSTLASAVPDVARESNVPWQPKRSILASSGKVRSVPEEMGAAGP